MLQKKFIILSTFSIIFFTMKRLSYGLPRIDSSIGLNDAGNSSSFPYFDFNVSRNITTIVGQSAFLHCRVNQIGDKSVSWIRKRDLHILTAGILTYTTDQRFQVIRPEKSENWTLHIKFPQIRDSGIYECQVNTEPKLSLAFILNVIESKSTILGGPDMYVKTGSPVLLTCVLNHGPSEFGTVMWYKDQFPVQHMPPRVTIDTDWADSLTSRLHINWAVNTDSGNYSCVPTSSIPSGINVHVISGEHPAAMQHGNASTAIAGIAVNSLIVYCVGIQHIITRFRWF